MNTETKITFLGDFLCEKSTLDTFRTTNGWDFRPIFADIKDFLSRSDYVLANLETPIAENDADLTHERWCFNSPSAFAEAVKDAGVDFVFTANNHCLDRGTDGLRATLRALDAIGLPHTGTFADPDAAARPAVIDVNGFKLAVASYTYGTNAFSNHQYLKSEESFMVNLFQEQELAEPLARAWFTDRNTPEGKRYEELEKNRWPENLTLPVYERVAPHANHRSKLKADLASLKALSPDFTIVSMHTGGQYNPVATPWTKELTAYLFSCGADIIAGTHEHVVHGCDFSRLSQGKLATYCLGDLESQHCRTATPERQRQYVPYSIAWHLYLVRDAGGKARISHTSFSILKVIMENDSGKIKVVPAFDAWTAERNPMAKDQLAADMRAVAARFTEQPCDSLDPAPEYAVDARNRPSPAAPAEGLVIDADIPSGNIIIDGIEGDEVRLRQDMRDSADWFYFAFRVKGAQGRTLKFIFTDPYAEGPLSCRGPAVSKDGGKTWSFAAEDNAGTNTFSYTFAEDETEVWFFHTFQYFPWQWDEFLARHDADRGRLFVTGELCKSRKGRSVPNARFGRIDGQAKYRVFLSSRHHCQEAPATYVLEGILEQVFAKSDLGDWLRENVEFMVVPFVDYDGVIDGDQGKGRKPHDHNRDYNDFIYPETRAITEWVGSHAGNAVDVFFDIHSPWVRNMYNERVYLTYGPDEKNNAAKKRWGEILERLQSGSMSYKVADNFPWNFGWNAPSNVATGLRSVGGWASAALKHPLLVGGYEVPFAKANDKTVTPESCRIFGNDSAKVLREFLCP